MGRPAKSVNAKTGHDTSEDLEIRKVTEEKLKGNCDMLKPPKHLTSSQKKIFKYIIKHLEEANILGNLDIYILSFAAVTIDGIIELDTMINDSEDPLIRMKMMGIRDKYSKDFFRCLNELSLSPQARAKISIANVKAVKEDRNPLLEALDL